MRIFFFCVGKQKYGSDKKTLELEYVILKNLEKFEQIIVSNKWIA